MFTWVSQWYSNFSCTSCLFSSPQSNPCHRDLPESWFLWDTLLWSSKLWIMATSAGIAWSRGCREGKEADIQNPSRLPWPCSPGLPETPGRDCRVLSKSSWTQILVHQFPCTKCGISTCPLGPVRLARDVHVSRWLGIVFLFLWIPWCISYIITMPHIVLEVPSLATPSPWKALKLKKKYYKITLISSTEMWIDLDTVIQSEVHQKEKRQI